MDDFAVFILSHGRADHLKTFNTLKRDGYTGKVYIVIDNEDPTAERYRELYGAIVVTFNKQEWREKTDTYDNFKGAPSSVVFARNACWDIAKTLGVKWFLMLDDDYRQWEYRFDSTLNYGYQKSVRNLDGLFAAVLEYYKSIPALTIAFAQGGDLIGGARADSVKSLRLKRKAMNTFFCSTERPFDFMGRVNEDVTAYIQHGRRGKLIFSIFNAVCIQTVSQTQEGGLTDIYRHQGTYVKSFYTVMGNPSCVTVRMLNGTTEARLHHLITWENAVPVIIGEQHRKIAPHEIAP